VEREIAGAGLHDLVLFSAAAAKYILWIAVQITDHVYYLKILIVV
jgi:hypothetical protein